MHLSKNIQLLKKKNKQKNNPNQQPKNCTSQEPTYSKEKKKNSWTKCSQLESQNKTRLDTKSPWHHELTNTHQPHRKSTSHSRICSKRKHQRMRMTRSHLPSGENWGRRKERKRDKRFQQLQHTLHHHFLLPLLFFNNYY